MSPGALDSLRERFRKGHEKYQAGAFADAIVIWESIYRELGSEKGYRLTFDIAHAYEELGQHIKAAEHYETFLERIEARRRSGEIVEPQVAEQETDARDRIARIAAIKARIHISASEQGVPVQVDNTPARPSSGFTVYVEPGDHRVTFGSGTTATVRNVTLGTGELLELTPPEQAPITDSITVPRELRWETRTEHPFSPTVLWVGAGLAVASVLVPVLTYSNALSIKSDYDNPTTSPADRTRLESDYSSARTNAYASLVVPALFTAAVGTLAVWYVLRSKETRVPATPALTARF